MTGFGRATGTYGDKTISIEIRSLNSKFTDTRFKLPQNYKEKEPDLRRVIIDRAKRGKIDLTIDVQSSSGDGEFGLNPSLFRKYYVELKSLVDELDIPSGDLVQAILRLPNVVQTAGESVDEAEWTAVLQTLDAALNSFHNFRSAEGEAMETDCKLRIRNILAGIEQLDPFEAERITKLRHRLAQNMEEYVGKDNIDANRFEQEILYYLEKIDVTEEKVRLEQHCKYFLEQLNNGAEGIKGRKLSFISQEMGREINTLGSKANSSNIQRLVVQMKDDLEKIKELVANIL